MPMGRPCFVALALVGLLGGVQAGRPAPTPAPTWYNGDCSGLPCPNNKCREQEQGICTDCDDVQYPSWSPDCDVGAFEGCHTLPGRFVTCDWISVIMIVSIIPAGIGCVGAIVSNECDT